MSTYRLDRDAFVIDDYAQTRPFASFLPGIAGLWGVPMWVFYVNRGQGIAGFGIHDKDHPIMEFLPANKAYRIAALHGFRTFLKITIGRRTVFHEPFQAPVPERARGVTQRMRIRMHDIELEEDHRPLALHTRVQYFTIPHAPFAALARVVTLTNRGRRPMAIDLVDGLPLLIPNGMLDRFLKTMSRTIEAWVVVRNLERRAPFYHLKVEPHDRPEVVRIHAGNFFVACTADRGRVQRLEPIVDPAVVFGQRDDCTVPDRFLARDFRVPARQLVSEKTPSAFGFATLTLAPGASRTIYALYGHMASLEELNASLDAVATPEFFAAKAAQNQALISQLTDPIATASGSRAFDLYCRQTFLDNAMRGGVPTHLGRDGAAPGAPDRKTFYVFSRKHGDLERDYNYFVLPASYFSQGNANYRDVNQNRRSDVWFYPELGDSNIVTFFNLLQADGFNPLVFKGLRYVAPDEAQAMPALREVLSKPFTPGELLDYLRTHQISLNEPVEAFLNRVMARAVAVEDAEHGEGFWSDHWTYNLDLLESYLSLYPDALRELLLERRVFTFYDNAHVVQPRAAKYHLAQGNVRQYHAVRRDPEKAELLKSRPEDPHRLRTQHGRGPVYTTTLLVKMLAVAANKLASLDPSGLGIEMDAEKPNWYDALNGLPGLLGSSLCETFELQRWVRFLLDAMAKAGASPAATVAVPEEIADLIARLEALFAASDAEYWAESAAAKEAYREQTRLGVSGRERAVSMQTIHDFLQAAEAKLTRSLRRAFDAKQGVYPSYFYHEVTRYTHGAQAPAVVPTAWQRHTLPLFLEGLVHALRVEPDPAKARALHAAVRRSPLYDRRLQMYKVCASLADQNEEIGRCRVFTPGWLENESVWLHMEYKYLLELLRRGLHEEFYDDFFRALIPFQPPKRYGRSILENSSFLVSSAHPDAALHGAGFVARLSGATAEFLQMWLWMTAGREPFRLDAQGRLELRLAPALHAKLFDASNRFTSTLLGGIRLTYANPRRRSTFGAGAVWPGPIRLTPRTGEPILCPDGVVPAPYAQQIRAGGITAIDVELIAAAASPRPRSSKRAAARR